jgi:hypothetical protein
MDGNFDLSQRWIRHLRETAKSFSKCPFCQDEKVLPDFDALYNHVLLEHANQAPPKEDREKTVKFKESLWAQTYTSTTPRSVYSNFFPFLFFLSLLFLRLRNTSPLYIHGSMSSLFAIVPFDL